MAEGMDKLQIPAGFMTLALQAGARSPDPVHLASVSRASCGLD